MNIVKEFRDFAVKGNAVDMAVGIIIGAAFGKVVNSIVNDLVMPVVGILLAGSNFVGLKWVLKPELKDEAGKILTPEVAVRYGQFISVALDFLIMAVVIFLLVKLLNRARTLSTTLIERKPAEQARV